MAEGGGREGPWAGWPGNGGGAGLQHVGSVLPTWNGSPRVVPEISLAQLD